MKKLKSCGRLYYVLFHSDSDFGKRYSTVRADRRDDALHLALLKYSHLVVYNVLTAYEFGKLPYKSMGFTFLEDITN